MKKFYFVLALFFAVGIQSIHAQLLQWNTFGNLGTETTEPSVANDPNVAAANLTQGAGITPAANGNRFGGNNWFNTGNTNPNTLAEAITGNDYLQFIVTPNVGFSFTPTSFVFTWDRSGTGPQNVTLRSSADGFIADLGTITGIVGGAFASNTITITGLTNITTATTFRLYGYNATATTGTGGFDANVNAVNVQLNGTTAPAGTPLVTVTPVTLTGFTSLAGVPSPEQTYTVSGSNLTNDISIVPPAGFEVSPTTAPFVPTNPITLTQTGGNVPVTTIYVRMNSATLGVNTGNITHTSAGSNNPNVSLSGNVLAAEPTTQGVITIGTVTNSSIEASFTAGDGARQILVIKALTPVANNPVDGTTYTANTTFGAGSNLGANTYVVYNGVSGNGGAPVTITGLSVATQYHFALYEYNDGGVAGAENYLVTPLSTANATTLATVNTYLWTGVNGTSWTDPLNWLPVRTTPATNDSLLFETGLNETVTNVPAQTIGYLGVSLGTTVNLQAAVNTTTLTIGNSTGTDLFVEAGSSLNISTANGYTINLVTGAVAVIDGTMTFTAGAHKLTAADANGITFSNGSVFTAGTGMTGNPFGTTGTANSVIFTNGSEMNQSAGSNPFALAQPASIVVFQTGSLFRLTANITPSVSGRTYANFELDFPTATITATGTAALTMDNLTVTNGSITFGMTTGGFNLRGNVSVAPGATLGFAPASLGVLNVNGTTAQSIVNNGTLTYGAFQSLTINNAAGVTLNSNITLGATSTLALTAGILRLVSPATLITLSAGTTLTGGNSNASYVDGKVRKIGNTNFTFPVGKTGFGYVPIGISNFVGGAATDQFDAEYLRGNARLLGAILPAALVDHVSGCDYWTLDRTNGTPTVDVTAFWSTNNVCNGTYIDNLAELALVHFDGTNWNSSSVGFNPPPNGTVVAGDITWPGVTTFSPFSLGSSSVNNPLPIIINYFTGAKQNSNHLLNWKLTCTSTPSVNMQLERSSDGRNFSTVYSLTATALQCRQPFNFTDANPAKGINYYRLKLTDADGKLSYSTQVSLINASKGIDVMNIAPNPVVGGKFNVNISAAQATNIELLIMDMQGRMLQKQLVNAVAGFNMVPVDVRNLSAGTYQLIGYSTEGRTRTLRFVIQ